MKLIALTFAAAFAVTLLPAPPLHAQLGACLGSQSVECHTQRRIEEMERQNRLRHEEQMRALQGQQQRSLQLPPPPPLFR